MKKILFMSLIFSIVILKANAQIHDTSSTVNNRTVDARQLLLKSKKQKTVAWILLGGGTIAWLAGVSKAMNQLDDVDGGGKAAMVTGGIAVLSSIPFFIIGSKNKKKAINFSFSNETAPRFYKQTSVDLPLSSLNIKISL